MCEKKQPSGQVKKLVLSGVFLALALVLPFFTGQMVELGNALCPMHIPVLLCGFICGWQWGMTVGMIAPLLRFVIFLMPPIFPIGAAMSFELATYGLVSGLLYKLMPKKRSFVYVQLLISMIAGRLVWGAARFVMAGLSGSEFSAELFLSGAVTGALPGIICQLVLIPPIVIMLKKADLAPESRSASLTE